MSSEHQTQDIGKKMDLSGSTRKKHNQNMDDHANGHSVANVTNRHYNDSNNRRHRDREIA
jgi:hypothetical protein